MEETESLSVSTDDGSNEDKTKSDEFSRECEDQAETTTAGEGGCGDGEVLKESQDHLAGTAGVEDHLAGTAGVEVRQEQNSDNHQQQQADNVYGYEDAVPTRRGKTTRRGSLVERVMGWASSDEDEAYEYEDPAPTRRARRGSLVERVVGSDQQEEDPYGYGDAAPTRREPRRGSLMGRVMGWDQQEENPHRCGDAAPTTRREQLDENPYGYEDAAPTRREPRRGSLVSRVMGWDQQDENTYGYEDATPTGREPSSRRDSSVGRVVGWDQEEENPPGYEDTTPGPSRRQSSVRRGSMVERIMAWAGAVNQEHFYHDSEHYTRDAQPTEHRRASMHGDGPQMVPSVRKRRAQSSDEIDDSESGEFDNDLRRGDSYGDNDYPPEEGGRVERRNSLHAMVERAMAYVNMTKDDPHDGELCAFGTRRDSLF
jgi:hypothetical protein